MLQDKSTSLPANRESSAGKSRRWWIVGGVMSAAFAVALVLGIAACALVLLWNFYDRKAPDVDYELNMIRSDGLPATAEELDSWYATPPDDQNAATVLLKAFETLHGESSSDGPLADLAKVNMPRRGEPLAPELKTAATSLITQNEECLNYAHHALEREQCRFPFQFHADGNTDLSHLTPLRELQSLLALRCQLALEASDRERVYAALQDEIRLAHTLFKEPVTLSQVVRTSLHQRFLQSLEGTLSRNLLSESQLAALQVDTAREVDSELMFKAMVGERCIDLALLLNGPSKTQGLPLQSARKMDQFRYSIQYAYLLQMGRLVKASRMPVFERIQAIKKVKDELDFDGRTLSMIFHIPDAIVSAVVPGPAGLYVVQDRHTACVALEQTTLAIERYRIKRGAIPPKLEDLVPELLDAVPNDPFTGKPLIYETRAQGYVLKSAASYPPGVETPKDGPGASKLTDQLSVTVNR